MSISASQLAVARALAQVTQVERPQVGRYLDTADEHAIDVLTVRDRPSEGLSSSSTIGLHMTRNLMDGVDIRVELMLTTRSSVEWTPNLLSTAAFYVMKDGWLAAPGVVFPELLREYDSSVSVPHLMWVAPFTWPELGSMQIDGTGDVHWLVGLPISDGERDFLGREGFDALDLMLEKHDAPYFDVHRASVV
ncbi:suppressor of fused domain protein [Phycicoccus avicenniae]|uniref:suppressor of fused domain protein n=1 Tax=Phycicoccus avicenniae TaxID=2828860 RepID=UPI003D2D2440